MKVCKFGGSSLADAGQLTKVIDIVLSDPQRRIVVVSAPGKRNKGDTKVTDLLGDPFQLLLLFIIPRVGAGIQKFIVILIVEH